MVGPAPPGPSSRGGMATVVGHMADQRDPGIEVRLVTTYVDSSIGQRLRAGAGGMLRGTIAVARRDVDVVHVHLSHGGSVVRKSPILWAARLRGVPAVVHGHSFGFGAWMAGLPTVARSLVRGALPADRWLVLGEGLAEEYRTALGLPGSAVDVLYNPVATAPVAPPGTPAAPDDRVEAVALGRLGARKGSYDLVAAVASLPAGVRDRVHVTLAGDGEVAEVRAAVTAAGLADTITVRDWLGPAERDELLAAADVFVLPSYEEGLPMALLEAMAAGLAPLTTPVGGIPEAVTDGVDGLLVSPGDVPALASALAVLVSAPERRAVLAAGARRRAEDFALDEWRARLAALWTSLAR